jgi:hypothetical protein
MHTVFIIETENGNFVENFHQSTNKYGTINTKVTYTSDCNYAMRFHLIEEASRVQEHLQSIDINSDLLEMKSL